MRVKDLKFKLVETVKEKGYELSVTFGYLMGFDSRISLYLSDKEVTAVIPEKKKDYDDKIRVLMNELQKKDQYEKARNLWYNYRDGMDNLRRDSETRLESKMGEVTAAYIKMLQALLIEEVQRADRTLLQTQQELEKAIRNLNDTE